MKYDSVKGGMYENGSVDEKNWGEEYNSLNWIRCSSYGTDRHKNEEEG